MPELDRRQFLKIIGVGAGAAATAGCQEPVEKVIPYLNQPEEIVPGIATHYYSTCRECPAACSLDVKTREGRPIKVDGNLNDPTSRGSLCLRGQASLHRTFTAARFAGPMKREGGQLIPIDWEEGISLLAEALRPAAAEGKVFFLSGLETGTLDELIDEFLATIGSTNRARFELFAYEALRTANERLFAADAIPHFALDKADVIVSFGTDFLETWLNPVHNQIGFSSGRKQAGGYAALVGPRMGLSGSNTDEWFQTKPGSEMLVALALAHGVARHRGDSNQQWLSKYRVEEVASRTGVPAVRLERLADRIAQAAAPLALPPGNELLGTNAVSFNIAVQVLNHVSGAIGETVVFGPDHNLGKLDRFRDVKQLAGKMRGGEVGVLLIHGTNPVYTVPQVGFADAMAQSGLFKVSFSSTNDETTALADLVLPDHTPYESWGDAEPIRGVRRVQQPTVQPLMNTRGTGDVLVEVAGRLEKGPELGPGTFRDRIKAKWGMGFDRVLANGGTFEAAPKRDVQLNEGILPKLEFETAQLGGDGDLTLIAYPSINFYDGRSACIPMLQEVPDAVLKTTWGSFAEIHPDTARSRGLVRGDVVRITTEAGSIELPAFPHETVSPGVVAVAIGQGHQPGSSSIPGGSNDLSGGKVIGVNVLEVLPGRLDSSSGGLAFLFARAKLESTGRRQLVASVQDDFDQEGRGFAKETALAVAPVLDQTHASTEVRHGAPSTVIGDAEHLQSQEYDPAGDADPNSPYRWGMTVDLDACTGCGACITACNQENNILIVGEKNVIFGREMHWIRVERFVEHHTDGVQVRHCPMLCQHCGAAPCENVCPVIATYHNGEGLNVMLPNRCVGSRYCSNNCPYKVRRYNYFPYDQAVGEPGNLVLNPDVTVRAKGVMEKCTFCVQRIIAAKDQATAENRTVRDGEITPACARTCPSNAIVFGNLRDRNSQVSQLHRDARAYRVLDHLYTRPAISYLKSIKRNDTHG